MESETTQDGFKTVVFHQTRPLPTYLLAIAAGPLESVPITGLSVPGRVYTIKGQSRMAATAVETTPPILAALEKFFGRSYPYAKLDLIAVPEFWPGAMENAGAVTYRDRFLLIDPETASVGEKAFLVYVTAHELSHMWFGDLVTMAWWDDLWLNESFATWLGEKVTADLYPQYDTDIDAVLTAQRVMRVDARPSTKPIRRPVNSVEDIMEDLGLAYDKGKVILGMVEQWVGPVAFREGVVQYVKAHEWGSATGEDLWNALTEASGTNVEPVLASFLDQAGYPMIDVADTDGGLIVSQRRFLNYGVDAPGAFEILQRRDRAYDHDTAGG